QLVFMPDADGFFYKSNVRLHILNADPQPLARIRINRVVIVHNSGIDWSHFSKRMLSKAPPTAGHPCAELTAAQMGYRPRDSAALGARACPRLAAPQQRNDCVRRRGAVRRPELSAPRIVNGVQRWSLAELLMHKGGTTDECGQAAGGFLGRSRASPGLPRGRSADSSG